MTFMELCALGVRITMRLEKSKQIIIFTFTYDNRRCQDVVSVYEMTKLKNILETLICIRAREHLGL